MKPLTAGIIFSMLLGSAPYIAHAAQGDIDNDGVLNEYDPDMDGDGIPNQVEKGIGMRFRQASDGAGDRDRDRDGDGWTNAEEYRFFTDIHDASNNRDLNTGPDIEKAFGFDAPDGSAFGYSVEVEGDWAVIGAPQAPVFEDSAGDAIDPVNTGAVYVYHRENGLWELHDKLTAHVTDAVSGDAVMLDSTADFGTKVALTLMPGYAYPTIMATAPGIDAAFVFKSHQGNWQQTGEILAPVEGERFADSMDLDGTTAVIGAPYAKAGYLPLDLQEGKVYVYNVGATSDSAAPVATTNISFCDLGYCEFGNEVILDGDTLLVSGYIDGYPGSMYVYRFVDGNWAQEGELESVLSTETDFGTSMALSGDRVLIGALNEGFFGLGGNIYEFTPTDGVWTEQGAIFADDFGSDRIGIAMDLDGDVVLLSDSEGDVLGLVNMAGTWVQLARDHAATDDDVAHYLSVDAQAGFVLIGSPHDNDAGTAAGASYFVDLTSIQ